MTDITIGKGLLLFAFICGFFSGRVIKFIDRLKDLLLPVSDSTGNGTTTNATNTNDTAATGTDTTDTNNTVNTAETTPTKALAVIENPDRAAVPDAIPEPVVTVADITVSLQLAPAVAQSPDGPDIAEAGFNNAKVMLQPADSDEVITLTPPTADEGGSFTIKQLPFGDYSVTAEMAYKNATTIINLSANQAITVNEASQTFDLPLSVTPITG